MKKAIVAISLSLIMATGYSADLSDVDQTKFNAAVKAYRMNQSAKALVMFTELYKDYPQNQQIKNNYAVVLFATGKLEQAEEVLSSVIESNKEVNVAYKNLNKIYDYAAAKAYSNALGTEKEVAPQKLQLIETIAPSAATTIVAANQTGKGALALNDSNLATGATASVATQAVASNATEAAKGPTVKNKVQAWADTWSKADINNYVAKALKDVDEPSAAGSVKAAVLDQPETKAAVPVATTEPAAKVTQAATITPENQVKPAADEVPVVEEAVRHWAAMWSKGDADGYIAFYEPTFRLGKMSHNQWIRNRKERVTPAENIQVKLSDLIVTPSKTDDTMIAHFKQSYQANRFQDNTTKRLIWKKIGDKWFIRNEINVN
ncbi:MAG: tetratricopeptide repeat protein [Methylococcales bacterium]